MRPRQLPLAVLVLAAIGLGGTAQAATGTAAAAIEPADPMNTLPHDLEGEIRRVQLLRAKGDYSGAIHSVAQMMLVAPDDARVVGEYGKALVQAGRASEASEFLQRAIQLQPDNWTFYSAMGVAEDQLGHSKLAGQAYRRALALKPGEPSVLNNLALSLTASGNLAEAEALLREAAANGGDNARIAENLKRIAALRAQSAPPKGEPESVIPRATGVAAALPTAHDMPRPLLAPQLASQSAAANPRVIMGKIPYDPLAGKHYPAAKEPPAKLADRGAKPAEHVAATEPAKKPADPAPVLRTAADIY